MNINQMTQDLDQTTLRLNTYHTQISKRLAQMPTNDPSTMAGRAKVSTLREKLNRGRIAVGAVRVGRDGGAPVPPATERLDLERMAQDLDRTAERMNTYHHRVEAWLSGVGRADPIHAQVVALQDRIRTARVAVLGARAAAIALAPSDYRIEEFYEGTVTFRSA